MKLVRENINELNFERKKSPLGALGIGKKTLIKKWLDEMNIDNYIINDNFTIDVNGKVDLADKNLIEFPEYIQFSKCKFYFDCNNNKLISLRGCPQDVYGSFNCSCNQLVSLDGCPLYVSQIFNCNNNKIRFTVEYVRKLCEVGEIVVR